MSFLKEITGKSKNSSSFSESQKNACGEMLNLLSDFNTKIGESNVELIMLAKDLDKKPSDRIYEYSSKLVIMSLRMQSSINRVRSLTTSSHLIKNNFEQLQNSLSEIYSVASKKIDFLKDWPGDKSTKENLRDALTKLKKFMENNFDLKADRTHDRN